MYTRCRFFTNFWIHTWSVLNLFLFCYDRNFQESFDTYRAAWDVSGDPCPVVKYEWQIQRLDGLVVQQWLDVGGMYFFVLNVKRQIDYMIPLFLHLSVEKWFHNTR